MVREDTFDHAHQYLMGLTDEELHMRFWHLTQEIVDPLVDLARTHTSPSIERSVLMRMGIDTPHCVAVVSEVEKRGLLGHGAGHVVLVVMQALELDPPAAARRLADLDEEAWRVVDEKWGAAR